MGRANQRRRDERRTGGILYRRRATVVFGINGSVVGCDLLRYFRIPNPIDRQILELGRENYRRQRLVMKQQKETHVDDFIDEYTTEPNLLYAKWFLFLHRLPAMQQVHFADFIGKYKLFATWRGNRYRVTGASRLGDVWLTNDFTQSVGYEKRVCVDELDNWRRDD